MGWLYINGSLELMSATVAENNRPSETKTHASIKFILQLGGRHALCVIKQSALNMYYVMVFTYKSIVQCALF